MKKIVLDTNVIIAAFTARGLANSVFELCLGKFEIIISDYILNEVSDKLTGKLKVPPEIVNEIINFLRGCCTIAEYALLEENVCRDSKDDNMLALARSSKSKYIVTGDKDLLALNKFEKTQIVNPRQLWQKIKDGKL
jgi:uncharacterized protein